MKTKIDGSELNLIQKSSALNKDASLRPKCILTALSTIAKSYMDGEIIRASTKVATGCLIQVRTTKNMFFPFMKGLAVPTFHGNAILLAVKLHLIKSQNCKFTWTFTITSAMNVPSVRIRTVKNLIS